ncbi:SH3 domain-containing protein [Coxiella burnetii]|uniref:Hypothetical exported protein n=2 Tax=Coxiella burnetii TaxID=777 RepID=Q83A79_COXBU|nr:SH3 domain-containing protein [Coxiella burnetii]NP_821002.1 hypothetical protein CBU_2029 [Coxiella burnetii RSA 493]AAO91516.1 hypothetical exported protein [Coxiella burnetii RSA 493]ABS78212.1 hypothetical exported protein [Coxiella burnetii Dugway 5J108-111]ABX77899.1 hypothetical protein COXBURSA331_A0054 [Coxiella burnetii RSA 331]ACJ19280.1 hypothetical exported protein [Coxiella burnetii CbuG_Q212]AML48053.1 hypothetical protein AUR58_01835 [Coxiella burnetii]
MRRLLVSFSIFFCILSGSITYATTQQSQQSSPQVNLYEKPQSNAKILQKLSPAERLIPIYRQKGWIKVGDPRNGEVGWVNRDQYHEALQKYYQPDIQTVFIRAEHNEKGKRTIDVVAYKNGKKLTDKEAQQLYEQIKNQQAKESRYMRHVFWDMDKLMAQQMRAFSRWMDNPWNGNLSDFDPTVVQPLIILSPAHSVSQSAPAISKSKKD